MRPDELADILSRMYRNAPEGEAITMLHFFGIKYASAIGLCGKSVSQLVRRSCVPDNHVREVRKGMKLAKYVTPLPYQDQSDAHAVWDEVLGPAAEAKPEGDARAPACA